MSFALLVQNQRALFQSGATHSLEFRSSQLRKLHDALVANESSLLTALHADLRKSAHDAFLGEIGFVLSEIRHALHHLSMWAKPSGRRVPWAAWPGKAFLRPEPFGVVLIIGPWNYPLQLTLMPLVGAVAAGNCVVLKPSEVAPHTAEAIAKLIRDTFATEYVTVCEGERDIAEALLRERFDKIFFTGGTAVGRLVMAAAARNLTPVTLELGGKCPCLVCADAPLEITARRIVWGKFMNAGQTCVAPDFLLVDQRIRENLLAALKRAVRQFYGESPQTSPDYGRIINRRHFERLMSLLATGRIVHGGQHNADDLFLAPTILTDVPHDSLVMQEEIFGPILPVLEFEKLDDALARLRNQPTPLALYLFTQDRVLQERVLDTVRSGGVCFNDTIVHILGKQLPFGGLGESGMGAYHGKASFDCFTHYRSVLRRSFRFDAKFRYPPPGISLETLKRVSRFLLGR